MDFDFETCLFVTITKYCSVRVACVRGHGVDPAGAGQRGPGQGGGALPDLAPQRRHVLPNILLLHHIIHWIQVRGCTHNM